VVLDLQYELDVTAAAFVALELAAHRLNPCFAELHQPAVRHGRLGAVVLGLVVECAKRIEAATPGEGGTAEVIAAVVVLEVAQEVLCRTGRPLELLAQGRRVLADERENRRCSHPVRLGPIPLVGHAVVALVATTSDHPGAACIVLDRPLAVRDR
jgi:hypothetical protein